MISDCPDRGNPFWRRNRSVITSRGETMVSLTTYFRSIPSIAHRRSSRFSFQEMRMRFSSAESPALRVAITFWTPAMATRRERSAVAWPFHCIQRSLVDAPTGLLKRRRDHGQSAGNTVRRPAPPVEEPVPPVPAPVPRSDHSAERTVSPHPFRADPGERFVQQCVRLLYVRSNRPSHPNGLFQQAGDRPRSRRRPCREFQGFQEDAPNQAGTNSVAPGGTVISRVEYHIRPERPESIDNPLEEGIPVPEPLKGFAAAHESIIGKSEEKCL